LISKNVFVIKVSTEINQIKDCEIFSIGAVVVWFFVATDYTGILSGILNLLLVISDKMRKIII